MTTPYVGPGSNPVDWVTSHYPRPLRIALERRGGIPHTARNTVVRQLGRRTPEQLRERIERRWYQRFAHLSAPELLERADDIAVQLVELPDCEVSDRCEDGWLLDEEANCTWCLPSGTVFDLPREDVGDGRRSSAETVARMAGSIRDRMRQGRRSLPAAAERARSERARREAGAGPDRPPGHLPPTGFGGNPGAYPHGRG
ncbi:hypothetical protein AB0D08_29630 [Kitasatospora sp. NPDC048540]|uniref:hypothetical protein n=1 Tax=unclassified Kitasatospora TaxID=2633591 RepID=UPI00053ACC12|nr:hypothetical protein [Kitasatospora sp. MBT63]